jgi:hypothetical protein
MSAHSQEGEIVLLKAFHSTKTGAFITQHVSTYTRVGDIV